MQKYKLSWRDISFNDFKVYLFALFKAFIPKKKIKNLDELEHFIQTKSAWVTQVTLYSYLKTRMGTRYVLHFDNDVFMSSLNIAKWNIYSVALQDLTFFTFSYLKVNFNFKNIDQSKEIFNKFIKEIKLVGEQENDPFEKPLHDMYKSVNCLAPINSLSYHISRTVPATTENWLKVWNENFKDYKDFKINQR